MIELEKIKYCYAEYNKNLSYYVDIDKYYNGKMSFLKDETNYQRSSVKANYNFIKKLVDEEAEYSFGNKITYLYSNTHDNEVSKTIKHHLNNDENYDLDLGTDLSKFHLIYEINYIDNEGEFRNKLVTPLNGNHYDDEMGNMEFFMYVHKVNKLKDGLLQKVNYIDVYDNENVYYYDNSFNLLKTVPHNFNTVPVGIACVGGKFTKDGNGIESYKKNNDTIYDTIKDLQDHYSTIMSVNTREVIDFNNSILLLYGIALEDKKDKDGNPILDEFGNNVKVQPVLASNTLLNFADKNTQGASWLLKDIPTTFIEMQLSKIRADIYSLTSHIDTSEENKSNVSGVALRSRLFALENKCKRLENSMANLVKKRIRCLFNYFSLMNIAEYDYRNVKIQFTPNIPQDINGLADTLSKIDHAILSNETKRSILSIVDDVKVEQEKIDKENENELNNIDDLTVPDTANEPDIEDDINEPEEEAK